MPVFQDSVKISIHFYFLSEMPDFVAEIIGELYQNNKIVLLQGQRCNSQPNNYQNVYTDLNTFESFGSYNSDFRLYRDSFRDEQRD
jgi:hypothetical protein